MIIQNMTTEKIYEYSNSPSLKPGSNSKSFSCVYNEIRNYHSNFPLEVSVQRNMNFLAHWHSDIEIVQVLEGSVTMGINLEKRRLSKGDLVLLASGDIHYYESFDTDSALLIIVFQSDLIPSISQQLQNSNVGYSIFDKSSFNSVNPGITNTIYSIIHQIHNEYINKLPQYDILIKGQLTVLVGMLLRYFHDCFHDKCKLKTNSDKSVVLVQEAIRYINLNYTDNISLKSIAEYLEVSTFYFSRIFSSLTGTTFKAYLNGVRINKAATLLLTTDRKIIDIAFECGFNSLRTFNRTYRFIKGNNPTSNR